MQPIIMPPTQEPVLCEEDELLEKKGILSTYRLGRKTVADGVFTRRVFDVYRDIYESRYGWAASEDDFREMHEADLAMAHSAFFLGICVDEICIGTARVVRWTEASSFCLPIEEEFGLNVKGLLKTGNIDGIWHGGRISINKHSLAMLGLRRNVSFAILQTLLRHGLQPLLKYKNQVMLVENDETFQKISQTVGIKWRIVGPSKDWLGSPTFPAMLHSEQLANVRWLQEEIRC